jgi:D-beta-D-heptose 7-phosphate kinase/D-beta-D-heptose 1-phosphate adenosyltransferase
MGEILTRGELAAIIAERQAGGARVVCTNGIFDLLHLGHVSYLQQARALGDMLVVCLNSDASAGRLKGPKRPIIPERERAEVLAALGCVDYVTIFGENTAESLVRDLHPAIYVKGADYAGGATVALRLEPELLRRALAGATSEAPELDGLGARLPEAAVVAAYGGELALLPYLPGHSTSELIQRIVSRYAPASEATGPVPAVSTRAAGGGRGDAGRRRGPLDAAEDHGG